LLSVPAVEPKVEVGEGPDRRGAIEASFVAFASVAIATVPVIVPATVAVVMTSTFRIFVATTSPTTAHGGHVDFLAQIMNRQHFSSPKVMIVKTSVELTFERLLDEIWSNRRARPDRDRAE
jgi:hypothetical protein